MADAVQKLLLAGASSSWRPRSRHPRNRRFLGAHNGYVEVRNEIVIYRDGRRDVALGAVHTYHTSRLGYSEVQQDLVDTENVRAWLGVNES